MAAALSTSLSTTSIPVGPADLQALEDRFERRFAEVELRHQRHLDSWQAKWDKDSVIFEEAVALAKRCEHDLEVLSEWRSEASAQLSTVAAAAPSAEAALSTVHAAAQSAGEDARKCLEAARTAQAATQERITELAAEVAELSTQCRERGSAVHEELDVQDLFQRSPWAKSLDRSVVRTGEKSEQALLRIESLETQLSSVQETLSEQHDDVRDLHARWGSDAADRLEIAERSEARLTEFAAIFDGVEAKGDQQQEEMRRFVEAQLKLAMSEVESCNAACTTLREALESEVAQLHGERAAMRRAWERVEALRKDETWGYFLRKDEEWLDWRADASRRLSDVENDVTQSYDAVWPELGKLGCRVADLHQMLDEYMSSKRATPGAKGSVRKSSGVPSAATPLISSGAPKKKNAPERSASARRHQPSSQKLRVEEEEEDVEPDDAPPAGFVQRRSALEHVGRERPRAHVRDGHEEEDDGAVEHRRMTPYSTSEKRDKRERSSREPKGERIEAGKESDLADGRPAERRASSSSSTIGPHNRIDYNPRAANSARTEQGTEERWSSATSALLLDTKGYISPNASPRGEYRHAPKKVVVTPKNHKLPDSEESSDRDAQKPSRRRHACDDVHVQRLSLLDDDLSNLLPDLPLA